jgi:hypothetical protein
MSKKKATESRYCKGCNKIFYTSSKVKQKFCSSKCRKDYYFPKEFTTRKCRNCNKEFNLTIKSLTKKFFCSNNCRIEYNNLNKPVRTIKCPSCGVTFNYEKEKRRG